MGQSRRGRDEMECTILAPSDPALSFRFWSIFLCPALVRMSGGILEMREAVGKLWVAKDGRKGERNESGVGLFGGLFNVCHGGEARVERWADLILAGSAGRVSVGSRADKICTSLLPKFGRTSSY